MLKGDIYFSGGPIDAGRRVCNPSNSQMIAYGGLQTWSQAKVFMPFRMGQLFFPGKKDDCISTLNFANKNCIFFVAIKFCDFLFKG